MAGCCRCIQGIAETVEHVSADTKFEITCYIYGKNKAAATLFEDDGITFDYEKGNCNTVNIRWNNGKGEVKRIGSYKDKRYIIKKMDGYQLIYGQH